LSHDDLVAQARRYYTTRLETYGPTPAGVDWNSAESQELRFAQLLKVADARERFSILDYGCGYGALLAWLEQRRPGVTYLGYDVTPAMIDHAFAAAGVSSRARFTSDDAQLGSQDFAVASGIFNVKLATDAELWQIYILGVIEKLDALSRLGFAFNILSSYSDPAHMRADLYYGDPLFYFDHCKRRYSEDVALLHDYGLHEFTLLVRKESR